MDGSAGAAGFSASEGAGPLVGCVACGTRFDSGGATTSDRVQCPICGEVVVLAELVAERRRYRPRFHAAVSASRGASRRVRARRAAGALLLLFACVVIALAFTPWAEELRISLWEMGRERFHDGKLK